MSLAQDNCLAQLKTPLGKDVLVLASFVAVEGLSELFEFNVEALSEQENINFDNAIGRAFTIKQITYDDKTRYYNGILTATRRIGKTGGLFHYNLALRPWLWLLGRAVKLHERAERARHAVGALDACQHVLGGSEHAKQGA